MAITIETLRAARIGDITAEGQLMDELYRPVYHFLRKRTGSSLVAEELCQSVFLKVYENIASYNDARAGLVTWVFTITRHTLIDYYRKERSVSVPELPDLVAEDITSDVTAEARARDTEAYLAKLLSTLPDEAADVVTLRAIDDMSYEQVGEIIGKSPEAVRQIYSRALRDLRGLVAGKEY